MQYGYLTFVGGIAAVWLALFTFRKDARSKMLWCGGYFTIILSVGFLIFRILFPNVPAEQQIVPGYWSPDTLFNLARVTHGWSIEDALYMFFTGGVASVMYDILFKSTIHPFDVSLWQRRRAATLIPAAVVCGMAFLLTVNFIWELIVFCALGALIMWFVRPDLIMRSLVGGIAYAILYYSIFFVFLVYLFPDYLATHYNLANLSGVFIGRLPLEEMLFALSFGLMWSPIYEYAKDIHAPVRATQ